MHSQVFNVFLVCVMAVLLARGQAADSQQRIVGGQLTTIRYVPYLVQLRSASWGEFFCGGTLVSPTHVVTAAHCLEATTVDNMMVVGGATTITEPGVQRKILKAYPHAQYKFGVVGSAYDVAVLKLSAPMVGPSIQTIQLCNKQMNVGELMQVSGWGHTSEQVPQSSHQVRTMYIPALSYDECKQRYGSSRIQSSMMCAGVLGKQDSCQGDSGGPGIYNGQLCAVVSFGKGCARPGYPGVYTNVLAVRSFIEQAMRT